MGSDKRARQKANRQSKLAELEAEAKTEVREKRARRLGVWGVGVAVIVGIFVLYGILTGDDDNSSSDTITLTPTPAAESDDAPEVVEVSLAAEVPSDFAPFAGRGELAGVDPAARNGVYTSAPDLTIDVNASYAAVLDTTAGTLRVELFAAEAPLAVNNFVNLARDGFYDGTTFHRVMENLMAQGGDPTGTGTGGPGYTFADEVDTGRIFDGRGLLAMANTGPDSNGSQFFITFGVTDWFNGLHTIFGQLVGDDAILDQITLSDAGEPTVVHSVRIIEG